MGYKRPIYTLVFDDPEMGGLEVKAKSVSIKVMREIMALSADEENPQTVFEMCRLFSGSLVSWNLEDDEDQPVPATLEGLELQDPHFVTEIIEAWIGIITRVDDASPLDESSDSGELSLVESIPMETLSQSQAS